MNAKHLITAIALGVASAWIYDKYVKAKLVA